MDGRMDGWMDGRSDGTIDLAFYRETLGGGVPKKPDFIPRLFPPAHILLDVIYVI